MYILQQGQVTVSKSVQTLDPNMLFTQLFLILASVSPYSLHEKISGVEIISLSHYSSKEMFLHLKKKNPATHHFQAAFNK